MPVSANHTILDLRSESRGVPVAAHHGGFLRRRFGRLHADRGDREGDDEGCFRDGDRVGMEDRGLGVGHRGNRAASCEGDGGTEGETENRSEDDD